jgi:sulfide:quinone oxidoreductase
VEFGGGRVGAVRIDASGDKPRGGFDGPSLELADEKREFGARRRERWFGS